jgi:drug/metabolite transporter (DMT)-like permease
LRLAYAALRIGPVSLVAPIVSTQGAVAAVIALVAGEPLGLPAAVVLGLIAVGVFLAGMTARPDAAPDEPEGRSSLVHALGAAVAIGWSLYAVARASVALSVAWALIPSRLIGVVAVTLPVALGSGLRMTRPALPLVAVSGVCEVLGFALYALGARHGIAVSAVLASQFGAVAAVAAYFLFGERLARTQIVGVAVILVGVGVLSAIRA